MLRFPVLHVGARDDALGAHVLEDRLPQAPFCDEQYAAEVPLAHGIS